MAATRLTKNMREEILHSLMERAYVERKEEIARMEHDLGMAVYNDNYPAEAQAIMATLPKEYFDRHGIIHAAFNGSYYRLTIKKPVPVGHHHTRHFGAIANYPGDHELTEYFIRFEKLKEEYEHDRQRLRSESFAILESCGTVKKLVETWSEIAPILQKLNISLVQTKEAYLPAVIQDMNDLFRLPPDGEQDDNQALAA